MVTKIERHWEISIVSITEILVVKELKVVRKETRSSLVTKKGTAFQHNARHHILPTQLKHSNPFSTLILRLTSSYYGFSKILLMEGSGTRAQPRIMSL